MHLTLLLLRHGEADGTLSAAPDIDRPLTHRGREQARRAGTFLLESGLLPERILASTARRAYETASLVGEVCHSQVEIETTPRLYRADPGDLFAILRDLPEGVRRVLLVGHNPALETFLEAAAGVRRRLTPASLARIEWGLPSWCLLPESPSARLVDLRYPEGPVA